MSHIVWIISVFIFAPRIALSMKPAGHLKEIIRKLKTSIEPKKDLSINVF